MNGRRYLLSLLLITLVLVWVRPPGLAAAPNERTRSEQEQMRWSERIRQQQELEQQLNQLIEQPRSSRSERQQREFEQQLHQALEQTARDSSDAERYAQSTYQHQQAEMLEMFSGLNQYMQQTSPSERARQQREFEQELNQALEQTARDSSDADEITKKYAHSTDQNQQAEMMEAFRSLNQYMQQSPSERERQQQEFERELNQALEQMARESSETEKYAHLTYQNEQAEVLEMFSSLNLSIQQMSRSERERQQQEFEQQLNQTLNQTAKESSDAGKFPERGAEQMSRSTLEMMQGIHSSLKEAGRANPE